VREYHAPSVTESLQLETHTCPLVLHRRAGTEKLHRHAQVSVGNRHACAIAEDDKVRCWGTNWAGAEELEALGRSGPRFTGRMSPLPARFRSVSVRDSYSCGITWDWAVACWGDHPFFSPPGSYQMVVAGPAYACGASVYGGVLACWGMGVEVLDQMIAANVHLNRAGATRTRFQVVKAGPALSHMSHVDGQFLRVVSADAAMLHSPAVTIMHPQHQTIVPSGETLRAVVWLSRPPPPSSARQECYLSIRLDGKVVAEVAANGAHAMSSLTKVAEEGYPPGCFAVDVGILGAGRHAIEAHYSAGRREERGSDGGGGGTGERWEGSAGTEGDSNPCAAAFGDSIVFWATDDGSTDCGEGGACASQGRDAHAHRIVKSPNLEQPWSEHSHQAGQAGAQSRRRGAGTQRACQETESAHDEGAAGTGRHDAPQLHSQQASDVYQGAERLGAGAAGGMRQAREHLAGMYHPSPSPRDGILRTPRVIWISQPPDEWLTRW
jgi:hypothetical protein